MYISIYLHHCYIKLCVYIHGISCVQYYIISSKCDTIVCFSSVGHGLQPGVYVIVVCIHFG